jgi:hypothetical protein
MKVFCVHSAIDQPQTGTSVMAVREDDIDSPSRKKSHSCHSPPASQAVRRVGPVLKPSASLGRPTARSAARDLCKKFLPISFKI